LSELPPFAMAVAWKSPTCSGEFAAFPEIHHIESMKNCAILVDAKRLRRYPAG